MSNDKYENGEISVEKCRKIAEENEIINKYSYSIGSEHNNDVFNNGTTVPKLKGWKLNEKQSLVYIEQPNTEPKALITTDCINKEYIEKQLSEYIRKYKNVKGETGIKEHKTFSNQF